MDKRSIAKELFARAVEAADPAHALARALKDKPFPEPKPGGQTYLIAIGKAAPAMLREAMHHAPSAHALAVTHHENLGKVEGATVFHAGHPVPDRAGREAAKAIIETLANAHENDQIIALISGGGSALLPAPAGAITLADKQALNAALLGSGLDIVKMNLIRQQVSDLKGGGFLRHAAPAPVNAYILSDVIGDDLRAIASGPTVGPIGTRKEAVDCLKGAAIWDDLPPSMREHLSAPAYDTPLPVAENLLIGSNRHSLAAMLDASRETGQIVSDALIGDVGDAAQIILEAAAKGKPGDVLLFGGETTVRLTGDGLGGRNQELALRVAMMARDYHLPDGWVFLSGGTDGRDGPTEAAGGIVDAGTLARIKAAGQDATALLANSDSNRALDAAGDLLITEATGTNVADVQIMLV